MKAPVVRVSAIGACTIALGRTRIRPDATVLFALVLYLAMRAGFRVPRAELLALLWGETPQPAHRHALRQLLYRLRRAGLDLDVDGDDLAVDPRHVSVDLAALSAPDWAATVPLSAIPAPGAILPGYHAGLTPAYAAWVDAVRDGAAAQIRKATLRHVEAGRREGRWVDVDAAARLCLATDPLNEEATLALAEATAMGGSKAEALRLLDAYLWELGGQEKTIGLPAKLLRRRISDQPHFRTQRTGEPPLMARGDDLAWLNGRLDVAASGVNCSALLLGPPGIGKTAVAHTFTTHAEMRGWRLVVSRLQPSDVDRPMSVFVELLPTLLKAEGALGAAPESIAQLRRLIEWRPDDEMPDKSQEAEAVQARIRLSMADLTSAVAHEGPIVMLLEDLHWIDAHSLRLLAWLHEHAAPVPVLWLLTARMESRFAALRETLPADRVPARIIEPLGAEDAAELFSAFAPQAGKNAPVAQRAHAVTGGNPLFIREVAGHWIETGGDEQLPGNLRALMRGRVGRLSQASQRVLHCCAVLGRFATVPRVATVLGVSTVELLEAIEELDGLGLLGLGGEPGSLALHDLWQEEMVTAIRPAARALLHLRSGEVLETESADKRSASIVSEAARHLTIAGARDRALRVLVQATEHHLANGLSDDAVTTAKLAMLAATTGEEKALVTPLYFRGLLQVGDWHAILSALSGDHDGKVDNLNVPHSDYELLRLESLWRANGDAAGCCHGALQCARATEASAAHRLKASLLAAQCAANLFDLTTLSAVRDASRSLPRDGSLDPATALSLDLILEYEIGSVELAIEKANAFVRYARAHGSVSVLARALRYASYPYRAMRDWKPAIALVRESFDVASQHQLAEDAAQAGDACATTCIESGDLATAAKYLALAEEWSARISPTYSRKSLAIVRASLCVQQGKPKEALAYLDEGTRNAGVPNTRELLHICSVRCRALMTLGDHQELKEATEQLARALHVSRGSVWQSSHVETHALAVRTLAAARSSAVS